MTPPGKSAACLSMLWWVVAVIILYIQLIGFVSTERVEVVLLHLGIGAVEVPAVDRDSVNRRHRTGAVAPSTAVNVDGPVFRVIHDFQKAVGRVLRRILPVIQRQVEIA